MELLYRLSLLAYPRRFRRRYGAAMLELFRVRMHRAARHGGSGARLRCLARGLGDSAGNALQERLGRSTLYERRSLASHPGISSPPLPAPRGPMSTNPLLEELRHAARRLLRSPIFTLATLLVLAVGIGANTTLFSVVSALMLRPQPFAEPERLVDIYQDSDGGEPNSTSFPAYRDIAAHGDLFAGVAAATVGWGATLLLPDGARSVSVEFVTADYFEVLGLDLQLGRGLEALDDTPGAPPRAILGDATWRGLYGADPGIVGETVRLNGASVTVVGVAPRGYGGWSPGAARDFFLSLSSLGPVIADWAAGTLERREDHWFQLRARLAPGVTPARAQAAMDTLQSRLAREFPELNAGRDITVFAPGEVRAHPQADGQIASLSAGLMVVAGLLLLLVCACVANLFLVRATSRRDEISIRLALGASRGRILLHVLSESMLLALVGGALGVTGALWGIRFLESGTIPLPFNGPPDLRLDSQVLAFSAVVAAGAGLLFGLFPALRLARADTTATLRPEGHSLAGGAAGRWLRSALVACQVTISFVILAVAGLYVQGLANAQALDLGIGADEVAVMRTDAGYAGLDDTLARDLFAAYAERIAALPGVQAVAQAAQMPVRDSGGSSTLLIDGYRGSDGTGAVEVPRLVVGPGYFETLGIRLLHGRGWTPSDEPGAPTVAVVSRAMAEAYWNRTDVVGERFAFQSDPDATVRIVGVVADVPVGAIGEEPTPAFYLSTAANPLQRPLFLVRTAGRAELLLPTLRRTLHEIEPTLPVLRLTTLRDHLHDALAVPRAGATGLAGFGLLGLVLAGIGLYAVVAFGVEQRTRELGIRIALGAGRGRVVAGVLREMLAVTGTALIAGLLLARVVAPLVTVQMVGVDGLDLLSLSLTALALAVTAAAAAWVPARRAVRLHPATALRME